MGDKSNSEFAEAVMEGFSEGRDGGSNVDGVVVTFQEKDDVILPTEFSVTHDPSIEAEPAKNGISEDRPKDKNGKKKSGKCSSEHKEVHVTYFKSSAPVLAFMTQTRNL